MLESEVIELVSQLQKNKSESNYEKKVLDNGKIVEDGTYDELIARNGCFAELVERQRIGDDTNKC
jgi:ABC-type transport system involved in cytochrome bd biosynthesis fused ATPase/permease subunit